MNEDEMQAPEPQAGEALERQLARYARVRLDPTPAQARRARAALMEAAWRRRLEPAGPASGTRRKRGLFSTWSTRRVAGSLAAAVLAGLLVGSTAFAASRAGGPLYEARITLEALTLPTDPEARLDAELEHAQGRLADLVEAAGRGDQGAFAAALEAYEHSLDELATTSGAPADRALEAIQFHRAVLLQLLGTVPLQALDGLQNAVEHSSGVIDRLDTAGRGTGPGGGGSGGGAGGGGNAGGAGAGGKPEKPATAEPTPRPTKPPKTDPGRKPTPAPNPGQGGGTGAE